MREDQLLHGHAQFMLVPSLVSPATVHVLFIMSWFIVHLGAAAGSTRWRRSGVMFPRLHY